MKLSRKLRTAIATFALAVAGTVGVAHAQYPERPITFIVPYGAGGSSDLLSRMLTSEMEEILGQPIVVENVAGGGGAVGLTRLYNADPDGYTIGIGTGTATTIVPHSAEVGYDTKDFTYIGTYYSYPFIVAVNPDLPINNLEELLQYGQDNPNDLILATVGGFGLNDVSMALLSESGNDFEYRTLPGQGSADIALRMLSGDANITILSPSIAMEHIEAGSMRPIAVISGISTPEIDELGIESVQEELGFSVVNDGVILAPPGLPDDIQQTLEDALRQVLEDPQFQEEVSVFGTPVNFEPGDVTAERTSRIFDDYGRLVDELLAGN